MPISLPSHGLSTGERSRVPSILVRLSRISRLVMPVGMPVGLRVLECMCGQIFSGKPLAEAKQTSINMRYTQLGENLGTNDQADQPREPLSPPYSHTSTIRLNLQTRAPRFRPIHMFENRQTAHHWVRMEVEVKHDRRVQ